MIRTAPLVLCLVLPFVPACTEQAAIPPIEDIAAPGDSIVTTFTDVTDALWLGARRWAVLAPGEVAVRVADFADGTMALLPGARGRDGVFQQPYAIFRALDSLPTDNPVYAMYQAAETAAIARRAVEQLVEYARELE